MTIGVVSSPHHPILLVSLYAPEDASCHKQLEKHLSSLKRKKLISLWSVDKTLVGDDQNAELEKNLNAAQIILLLLSANFSASEHCNDLMMRALQLHMEKKVRVVPIILRSFDWENSPVSALQVLPPNGKAVTSYRNRDETFKLITREIHKIAVALDPMLDTWTITETHRSYLNWLIKRISSLDTRGIWSADRLPQINLEDVYISLYAREEEQFPPVSPRNAFTKEISSQAPLLSLSNIVAQHDHLMILGEPGSGKTTLLHHLALKHALALLNQGEDSSIGAVRFPILLRISDYVEHGMRQGKSLNEFLAHDCRRHECPTPTSALSDLLNTELQAGRCLVLFDGLDEVVHADDRRMVVQKLEEFVSRYDSMPNRFILTSRGAGYHKDPLSGTFTHYILQKLEERGVRRFLESWYPALEVAPSPEETKNRESQITYKINDLMNTIQTIPGVRQLATNPLLLRILVQLHKTGAPIPRRRAELYQQITETLIHTWRPLQDVSTSALSKILPRVIQPYITHLLSGLAYWLHTKKPGGFASEGEIYRELGKEWARLKGREWREEDPKVEMMIKQFLYAVLEQTGILVEDTPRWYGFAHLTFEEYYTARYLIGNSQEQVQRIHTYLHDPRWQEPILLALGLVGMKLQEEAHMLVETAILAKGEMARVAGLEASPYEALLSRDYLFALRCLGDDIPVHPTLAGQLIERLLREITQQEGPGKFQKYQEALAEGVRSVEASTYASLLIPHLTKNLECPDLSLSFWSLYSLGRIGRTSPSEAVRKPLLKMLHNDDPQLRSAALWGLSQMPGPKITDTLLEVLSNDTDASVHEAAVKYLGERQDTSSRARVALLHTLQEAITPGSILPEYVVVESLGQLGDASPEVVSALIACLQRNMLISTGGNVIFTLSDESTLKSLRQLSYSSPEVVSMVADAFQNAIPSVRISIAKALETFDSASPEVIASLSNVPPERSPREIVQIPLCAKQWYQPSYQVEALLLLRLRDSNYRMRWDAVKAVRQLEELSDRIGEALLFMLQEKEVGIRTLVIETLNTFEMSSHVFNTFMTMLFNDPDVQIRACIVECLGDMDWPSENTVPALLKTLNDTNDHVRFCAVKSLGKITPIVPEVMDAFISALLHDTSFGVRWEVVKNLQHLEILPEMALSAVLQGLSDENWVVREDCALLLGQSGSSDERTLQLLLQGLSDADRLVRTACSQALVQLGQRFPEYIETIAEGLKQLLEKSDDTASSYSLYDSFYNVSYNALWLLKVGNTFEVR